MPVLCLLSDAYLTSTVVVKNPADFVGSVVGESEKNTKGILASTVGKILVIDEAYGFCGGAGGDGGNQSSDIYRIAVIDTLVAEVQSTPGDDRCVLLLGYKDQMEKMFQQVNPGLTRRFPLDSAFEFADFTDEEMGKILDLKLKQQGFSVTTQGKKIALDVLKRARNRPHYGNAGEVDIMLNSAKLRHQQRLSKGGASKNKVTFEASDIDKDFDRGERSDTNVRKLFEGTVGNTEAITKLEGYQKTVKVLKTLDMDPREQIPFNFLFRGPPGTGKTTTARKMGKVYYDMGFLASAEVIESSATDLVGQYVGHTGPKTQKLLEKAMGKVLLIDEAYRLGEGQFATEAMDEIVDCITKPKFASKLIIILAGYDEEINRLVNINPGLTSRFPESLSFAALSPQDCVGLLSSLLQERKQKLLEKGALLDLSVLETPSNVVKQKLEKQFATLASLPNWANARDVQTLSKTMFNQVLKSCESAPKSFEFKEQVVMDVFNDMIAERKHRGAISQHFQHLKPKPAPPQTASSPSEQHSTSVKIGTTAAKNAAATTTTESSKSRPPEPGPKPESEPVSQQRAAFPETTPDNIKRDAGVSDTIWETLQRDKAAAEEREKQYKDLQAREATLKKSLADALQKAEAQRTAARAPAAVPAAVPAAKQQATPDPNDEAKRRHEQERLQHELERRKLEEQLDIVQRKREEAERKRKEEAKAQQKLRQMGVCVAGFRWIKQTGGYRCAGGSHWVSDSQLGIV